MKAIGIDVIKDFDFIDKPKEQSINKSIETLQILGALSDPVIFIKIYHFISFQNP